MRIGLDISILGFEQQTGVGQVAEAVTTALVAAYPKTKFELFAFVPRGSLHRVKKLSFNSADNVRLTTLALPHKIFTHIATKWQYWPIPIEFFMRDKPDIFHHFDWYVYPTFAPMTATVYDLTPIKEPQWHTQEQVKLFNQWQTSIHQNAKHIFAISDLTRKDYLDVYPDMVDKVSVAYLGSSLNMATVNGRSQEAVYKTYQLPAKYFLYVGTLEPRKNLATLIEAFARLRQNNQEISLVVAGGQGWDDQAVYDLRAAGVHYLNYVPRNHLPVLYQNSVALVYPSLYEGFGLPVLEAMSCGAVVITSLTSSLPEVGGQAAYYTNPYQVDSVYKTMKQVLSLSPAVRRQRIQAGINQAGKFSYQYTVEKMMSVWQKLVDKRHDEAGNF